ncbi:autotransporter domain-containing protein [Achromobacter marplatensis]|uniref:Autotransporter domain-containing protein n=1 Tax=Achromobacter marplatensis TaxID=470868 RepID=A0AA42WF00_9BURK|nr:autotransporter domain-containing protein [Achromobacter marplatensis]MDH2054224.1 autotransporter domain-containing protein [Achromobacter marplatensis]
MNIQGAAQFGTDGQEGQVVLERNIPVSIGNLASLNVAGGTLKNGMGSSVLSEITSQIAETRVGPNATLDFVESAGHIKNLQGAGTVITSYDGLQPLTIEQGNYAGWIRGTSELRKTSTGTLTLSGTRGYVGPITIAGGTLELSSQGTYGNPGLAVVNNGRLVLNQFHGGVLGDISGTGGIEVTGQSLAGLGGVNTYSGTTTIDQGSTLLSFNGIGFPSQGRVLGTGAVVNNGELSLQYTGTVVIDNQISGVGKLSASDAGHVTLTANNTYSGETQIIGGGTLEVGNGGTTGSVGTGAVFTSPGATLIFNRSNDFSVDGVISIYQSTMAKIGAGKMTILGGLATNAGRVEVREGALHFGDGGTRGWAGYMDIDAAQGAELGFNHSDDMTLSGTLTGHGRLNQLGTGKLYFSADGSAFTGDTVVNGGELLMWGGSLGGTVTVNRGGRIQGNGSVGTTDVLAGGMLVSSGFTRLRVNGDLSLKDGSTVRYYLGTAGADGNSAGTTGTTRVSGNLDLNAKLQVRDNGQPTIGYYRLFTYGGTLSGTGLVLDTVPTGHSRDQVSVDTSRTGVVDLRVAPAGAPESLLAWRGGSGVWGAGNMQWQADGQSGWSGEWGAQHAVFSDAPGFVSVSGTQSFKGLQFVSDGWQIGPLAGAGGALQTAPDGSELRVLAGVTASIGAPIQGSGGLDKTGGGTLVLDGANNHTGGTRLSEGVLSVSQDASLGDASGGLTFNGGTLRVTGQSFSQTSRNLQWSTQGGAFDIASASNRFTVGQALSGAGDLVKLGAGTLVLTGTNAYGNTRVEAGTLVGNTDSIRGNLLNNGFVVFDQAASGTFGGDISGSGEATKAGAGVLTLSGRSAHNWRVTAGTLAASGGALSGNVDVGAAGALHLDAPQSSTYSGVLSGTGGLSKTGAGMLALTGDSAGFAGTTRIDQGILSVGINGQGKLGGQVTVARDAVLQGTGTVGGTTVQAGGIIAPGNSIGTLRVAGDLTLEAGSVYRVEADSQSNESDRIAVSGTANLGGSVLHVGPDGNLAGERSYTILTANRINGAFDSASSAFAYLDANLGYDAQAVTLRLDRKRVPVEPTTPSTPGTRPMRFADAAGTSNQRAAANALDSLSGANPLYQYVLTLPEGAPAGVFDSLSGEAHASVTSGLNNLSGLSRNLPFKSLRANLDAGLAPGAATAQAGGTSPASALPGSAAQPAWAELVGTWQTLDGNGNASRVDQRTGGVFVGADHAVGGGWRLGGALGYTDSRIRVDANSSKADVDSYSATVYGGKAFQAGQGKINLLVGAGYTWHDVSTTRNVAVAGQQDKLTADYGASTGQLFTEVGYAWPVAERAQLEPFAGVAWSDTRTRGFQESGGLAALSGESNRNSLTTTTLGLRGKTAFSAGKTEGVLRAAAGWRHAFGDVESRTRLAFNGSQPFTVSGAPLARDAAFTELGVDIAVSRSATIGITYSGQFGGGNRENAGSVGVTWRY